MPRLSRKKSQEESNEKQFAPLSGREYWATQDGRKLFPDQFEDEHLINTIKMLLRKAREYRLEEAKDQCEMFHRTGHRNLPTNEYYRYFKQQMDKFLDKDITDIDWLKEKSKIFVLLVEEAKYRKLEISTETKEKTTYSINPRRIFSNIYKGRVSNNSNTNTSTSYSLWA